MLAALALFSVATERRIERVEAITNMATWSVDAPERDPASPTGFENNQRRLVVPGHHNPSFWWIMEAQWSAEAGALRLRHIDYDAQPDGRDIRRTSLYRWWLIAAGGLYGFFNDEPLGYAIERGALFADPLLIALMLIVGAAYSARYLGGLAANGFIVGGVSLFPLAANFQPGAPDPHSLAWVLALGSVLPLVAALREAGTGMRTRRHFVLAGIFGGLGFWNDATSQAPVLLAIAAGAMGYEFVRSRGARAEVQALAPSPWRAWGVAGALTVLAASVFEFAPDHFSWSLDAVNPVHAVAWWGLGEAVRAVEIASRRGRQGFSRSSLALLGVAGLAIAAWPVVGMQTGSGALLATDVYAQELANQPGAEFARSFGDWLRQPGGNGAKWATLLPCVFLYVLGVRIFLSGKDRGRQGRLVFVWVVTLVAVVLATVQLRWWNLFDAFVLVALTVLVAEGGAGGKRAQVWTFWPVLLVLPGLFAGFPAAVEKNEVKDLSPLEAQALIARDFSYWLVKRAGAEPNVVFSTPFFSGAAAYYGGFKVITSTDGENEIGFQTCVRISSASSAQEASVLLQSRGITHLVLPKWDPTLDQFVRIGRNLAPDQPLPHHAFTVALREWDVPLWLRPMDYLIPNEPRFAGFQVETFAVVPEQEADVGLSRLADFFLDRGQLELAQAMRDVLAEYPRSVSALSTVASIDMALGDGERVRSTLETLVPSLSRRWARQVPVDRRIRLATLLFRTRNVDLAREQVRACFADLDAATLRTLTPGAVVNLFGLSRALEVPFPEMALENVALELIPPAVRGSVAGH